jgi:Na+-translocating ferredoxin:NAD+ oxidoreductase RnfG subunit
MKNLFQKPIFHYTFVLTVVAICCGLLIGAVNAVTDPIIKRNLAEAQAKAYQSVMPDLHRPEFLSTENDPSSISDKVEAYNVDGDLIGYIFVVYKTNSYGVMNIVIAVDLDGEIVGAEFSQIEQTLGIPITRNHLALFVGTQITDVSPDGDITAGVTGSYNTLKEMLEDVSQSFKNLKAEQSNQNTNQQSRFDVVEEVLS